MLKYGATGFVKRPQIRRRISAVVQPCRNSRRRRAEIPAGGEQGASRHTEEHGQSGKYKKAEEMHREAMAIMKKAFSVKDIFVIGYNKQLSIQRPPGPFEA